MKEIRFHGRGGQGVVKGGHLLVQTIVGQGGYAQFLPFFGVERKGSPVYGFARIDDSPIRIKTQVYAPHCVIILDDTLLQAVPVFKGLREGGTLLINTRQKPGELDLPATVGKVGLIDASSLAQGLTGSDIPNTAMLGALARVTGWVDLAPLAERIAGAFGASNAAVARAAYEQVTIYEPGGGY